MTCRTCKTCKHFEPKALHDSIALCHHDDLEVRVERGVYLSFQPPTHDGENFGCTLHEPVSVSDAAMQTPYNWGPDGKPEVKPFAAAVEQFGQAVDKLQGEQDG